jgi:hypothetical protein
MAGTLLTTPGKNFVGHQSIFQFENNDGADPGTACGQAAIATVLANRGRIPKTIAGLQAIEKKYPADVLSGVAGTSPDRIRRAMREHSLGYRNLDGRERLRAALRTKAAAIALIQNQGQVTAHWFVVFGCDAYGVHVTNYSPQVIAWSDFEDMWSDTIPTVAGMGERVICC